MRLAQQRPDGRRVRFAGPQRAAGESREGPQAQAGKPRRDPATDPAHCLPLLTPHGSLPPSRPVHLATSGFARIRGTNHGQTCTNPTSPSSCANSSRPGRISRPSSSAAAPSGGTNRRASKPRSAIANRGYASGLTSSTTPRRLVNTAARADATAPTDEQAGAPPVAMPGEQLELKVFARLYGEPVVKLPQDLYIPPDALEVFLDSFEGPLDRLYLICKQNFYVLDIPIAAGTRQYFAYIEERRCHNL